MGGNVSARGRGAAIGAGPEAVGGCIHRQEKPRAKLAAAHGPAGLPTAAWSARRVSGQGAGGVSSTAARGGASAVLLPATRLPPVADNGSRARGQFGRCCCCAVQ